MRPANFLIRSEIPSDIPQIGMVNRKAFGQPGEADLVDELRKEGALNLSLVAEVDGQLVGHVAFSPMEVEQQPLRGKALALGPMAVAPEFQGQGIGFGLLQAGLEACRDFGADIVIVFGHAWFYPKAGFLPASRFGLQCEFRVPDEAFIALELVEGKMGQYAGATHYDPAFSKVT